MSGQKKHSFLLGDAIIIQPVSPLNLLEKSYSLFRKTTKQVILTVVGLKCQASAKLALSIADLQVGVTPWWL